MKASDLIVPSFPTLNTSDKGSHALHLMNEAHVTHLPLVNEKKLLGLIAEEDILIAHGEEKDIGSFFVSSLRPFVKDYEHLFEVLKVSMELHMSVIPVVDKDENYLGAITRDKLLNYFASETDILEPGGIIVLELNIKDYLLSEIVRIIESANAQILCVFAGSNPDSNKMELTIKLNQTNLQGVTAALNRYGYEIKETFQEMEYFDALKERYDSLMNYLDI